MVTCYKKEASVVSFGTFETDTDIENVYKLEVKEYPNCFCGYITVPKSSKFYIPNEFFWCVTDYTLYGVNKIRGSMGKSAIKITYYSDGKYVFDTLSNPDHIMTMDDIMSQIHDLLEYMTNIDGIKGTLTIGCS